MHVYWRVSFAIKEKVCYNEVLLYSDSFIHEIDKLAQKRNRNDMRLKFETMRVEVGNLVFRH